MCSTRRGVIRADVDAGTVELVADLSRGSLAFVDRDWLPETSGPVPAIVVSRNGRVAWGDDPAVDAFESSDPVAAAARALLAVALEAAGVVDGLAPVSVTGGGLVAQFVRGLVERRTAVPAARSRDVEPPRAIVDTTGRSAAIGDATRRVAVLGTVVLVGESSSGSVALDLYPDVHVRGLTLVGVAPPLRQSEWTELQLDHDHLVWCRDHLGNVSSGAVVSEDAAWYCVRS